MLSLTQCWFTRVHVPRRRPVVEKDGSHSATCRHCARRIACRGKGIWHLADGFNADHLAAASTARFLYIVDMLDDLVVRRFPVTHLADEAEIRAYAAELKQAHRVDEPGSGLALRDSRAAS